ncbi:hypothetical protein RhiirA4_456466 [Rhizophagus irregularis]|uniref:Ion transport domain-containing protein n=1 Tax=Rhizophagus irregularis TaxID=588596 RepID=A0A2I1G7N0_9GLOM|nr:hypothetical protein RhiirA4_456466 [Rhizophagus irregularis]
MSEVSVKIDNEIDTEKIDVIDNDVTDKDKIGVSDKDKIENYHNGNPITEIEVSPKGRYLVTYSKEDHSIVGWNIENENEAQLKFEFSVNDVSLNVDKFNQICISDNKKLAYIYKYRLKLYDKMNDSQITLDFHNHNGILTFYCAFNLNNELILYNAVAIDDWDGDVWNRGKYFICIYSLQSKNNKLIYKCKRMYWLPRENKQVSISRSDKHYLFSNNSIYEFNHTTEKMIKIFGIDEEINYDSFCKLRKDIRISRNEKLICTRLKDKIIIYSIELGIPIVSLNINNANQLHMFMKYIFSYQQLSLLLFPLLLPLFNNIQSSEFWDAIMKDSKSLGHLKHYDQLSKEFLPSNIQVTSKFVFGILDGDVWMNDLEKVMLNMDTLLKSSDELVNNNFDEIIDNWYEYSGNHFKSEKEMYDYLIILLLNPYKETLNELFQKVIRQLNNHYEPDDFNEQEFKNLFRWTSKLFRDKAIINKIELKGFKKNNDNDDWDCICERVEDIKSPQNKILQENHKHIIKIHNRNDIIILTEIGLFIYHFNENSQSISLIYFYYMDISHIESTFKSTFKSTSLPLLNHNSFKVCNEWASNIKDNKNNLLKYGVELLSFAIKDHNSELIDDIYKKCINYFKEDLGNNKMFLSIITSTMPLLNEYYPEYILKYSLETVMIIDSPFYSIKYEHTKSHLYSYQHRLQIIDITQSIWWLNYCKLMEFYEVNRKTKYFLILNNIHLLIVLPLFPIYFVICYILLKYHFINDWYKKYGFFNLYFNVVKKFLKIIPISTTPTTPIITFVNPYIKFVNYPKDYNWFLELIWPQSSPFVETMNRDIYRTWNGEVLINFKWEHYGKYYYAIIWIRFIAFLGCFTAAATISDINDDIRNRLLIVSIILGFIHLSFEVRQIIYNPIKWIRDFWNIFDVIAYVLPIYTSLYWLQTSDMNDYIIQLLSFSCLFLDIKFLLFFRAFEYFGIYFAIIISVAKQIISFLVVLFIIIISFAHAFYILLLPRSTYSFDERTNSNDPNNPWNIVPSYNLVLENGAIDANPYIIQQPNGNTNMFVDFKTSLFAMYLFLTGDSSALTNWPYISNPSIAILIVLFSLLIVVYLMNLFIGLLNMAIEKDNNRVSYLMQKAEILAEIELFYLLPYQRRCEKWFPEVIYYYANVDKTREKIKEMMKNDEWNTDEFTELKQALLEKLNIKYNPDK